jgi:hypothetical protein
MIRLFRAITNTNSAFRLTTESSFMTMNSEKHLHQCKSVSNVHSFPYVLVPKELCIVPTVQSGTKFEDPDFKLCRGLSSRMDQT